METTPKTGYSTSLSPQNLDYAIERGEAVLKMGACIDLAGKAIDLAMSAKRFHQDKGLETVANRLCISDDELKICMQNIARTLEKLDKTIQENKDYFNALREAAPASFGRSEAGTSVGVDSESRNMKRATSLVAEVNIQNRDLKHALVPFMYALMEYLPVGPTADRAKAEEILLEIEKIDTSPVRPAVQTKSALPSSPAPRS